MANVPTSHRDRSSWSRMSWSGIIAPMWNQILGVWVKLIWGNVPMSCWHGDILESADKEVRLSWYQIGIATVWQVRMPSASYFKSKWWTSFAWATMPLQVSSTQKHFPHINPRCQCAQIWLFADWWLPTDNVQKGQMVFVSMLDFWCRRIVSFMWSQSSPNITRLPVSPLRAFKGFPLLSMNTPVTLCSPDSFSLSLWHQLGALETALCLNKLQQLVFNTILVLQDFSLFLDLTYSSNVISITCILCKTVSSASRTLVIT